MSNQQKQGGGNAPRNNDNKQKTVRIGDKDYTLQKVPLSYWLETLDNSKDRYGNVMDSRFIPEILKHIVVSPKTSIDDFSDMEHLKEVVKEAVTFQQRG